MRKLMALLVVILTLALMTATVSAKAWGTELTFGEETTTLTGRARAEAIRQAVQP
jgi:hypothetical protein